MKKLICLLLLLPFFSVTCLAESVRKVTAEEIGADHVQDGLSEDERDISGELKLDGSYDVNGALARAWRSLTDKLCRGLRSELGFAGKLLVIAVCCGLSTALSPEGRVPRWFEIGACCAATHLLADGMSGLFDQARETLAHLHDYTKAAFPAFFTSLAASGATASASVRYASVVFVSDLFMSLAQRLILPLIEAHLCVSICGALFDNALLRAVGKTTKWCAVASMSILCTVFCAYIGLAGVITGSADAAAVKTAKTVISSVLPVVGNILSNSASSILSAAGLIKNTAGVFCLISVCAICVTPFAFLSVKYLVYKASAMLSSLSGSERYAQLISSMGAVYGMLLGLIGSFGFMLFYSFLSGIRAVNPG